MKNIAVIFGGVSVEHDISVITGVQVLNALDNTKYNIYPILITKNGKWLTSKTFFDINTFANFHPNNKKNDEVFLRSNDKMLYKTGILGAKRLATLDCVIFATHGGKGENGALQGFIECTGIPYTSCGVLSSALCMDKISTKLVLKAAGLNVCDYLALTEGDSKKGKTYCAARVRENLSFPVIVKPAGLGSSIGISKACDDKQLEQAIQLAFEFDKRVLVESAVEDLTEINAGVLGGAGEFQISVLEQPINASDILSFDDKYVTGDKSSKGMASLKRKIPAEIDAEKEEYIKNCARRIFDLFDLKGVVRIDFLIDNKSGVVYVNEINTLPGSLSFYLWQHNKLPFMKLLDKLINIAVNEFENNKKIRVSFDSNVLKNFKGATKLN